MNSIEFTNEFNKVNYLVNRRVKFQYYSKRKGLNLYLNADIRKNYM